MRYHSWLIPSLSFFLRGDLAVVIVGIIFVFVLAYFVYKRFVGFRPFDPKTGSKDPQKHTLKKEDNGFTLLHTASLHGHVDVCKVLLTYSAAVDSRDGKGMCPLHYAAWGGHLAVVKLLLTGRIEAVRSIIDSKALNGETPLHQAARNGHAKVVTMILQYGGDSTVRNAEQMMAVDLASQFGRAVVVDALLSFRPDIITLSETSAYNHTPLHLAARNGHAGLVEMLLDRGHAINSSTSNGSALYGALSHRLFFFFLNATVERIPAGRRATTPLPHP